ncbi:delta(3,5)-Delta(2,4)-dienoyl-CoA isomerase, mitochondrial-like [Ictalurus furcatus]|uniref:delta(3,5)-Delta(2,4)-dienoyl-CoA isomerase, mitochondrial-like n=1 Tax=Ictalurus furcatus TaxID=66913 RepID=UPI00234FBD8C|nr:delta(3,5)-Delta(2,4)-dienoyl-CoA isomerase, mitochondrial-like [Ictalurus furcatus]
MSCRIPSIVCWKIAGLEATPNGGLFVQSPWWWQCMACVGAGVDLITVCDIRLCTQDAWFQVKSMIAGALEIAGEIAGRSPVAVQGTKINLLYS